jgi:hypothetical protein
VFVKQDGISFTTYNQFRTVEIPKPFPAMSLATAKEEIQEKPVTEVEEPKETEKHLTVELCLF